VVITATASANRSPVALQPVGVGEPGDGQAVLRLRVVDAVPTGEMGRRLHADVGAAAQDLGGQLEGDPVTRPGQQVDRHQRRTAHRVDVRQRVGCRDPAPVVGVVDDRGEEVCGGDDRAVAVDAYGGAVVAVVEADKEVAALAAGRQVGEDPLELAGRHLAGTAASRGVLGETQGRALLGGHPAQSTSASP
jgi:hypothetical protein